VVTNTNGITSAHFSLTPDGVFHVDDSMAPYLRLEKSGGLTVLTILGVPPK
jgi:hypothetical protein